MKRRVAILAAMLLAVIITTGTMGTAAAQEPAVHVAEADGSWREVGDVRFKVTWKGVVHVRWNDWLTETEVTTDEMGEVDDAQETVSVERWEVTATHATENTRTKSPDRGPRQVRFGKPNKLNIGETYTIAVRGFDEDDNELGNKQVTIRPVHVAPPQPVTGLTLSIGDDKLSMAANWTAPEAGGKPKRYSVWLTNLDTGRARWMLIKARQGSDGEFTLKTGTAFSKLWPGDEYRVSVQTLTHNSRWQKAAGATNKWQESDWTHKNVTMPAGDDPSYDKVIPTLMWELVRAGEKTPPYVIGDPTSYIVIDGSAPGGRAKFDALNVCSDHTNHDHETFFRNGDEDAMKARRKAQGQERILDVQRQDMKTTIAEKQKYLDATPEAERDRDKIAAFDRTISRYEANIEAGMNILAGLVSKLATECARAYPAEESLTQANDRWYQAAQDREIEGVES